METSEIAPQVLDEVQVHGEPQEAQYEQAEEMGAELSEAGAKEEANATPSLEAELEAERKKRKISENKLLCISLLQEHSLPSELCDILTSESAEETQKRVESVSKFVKKAINEQVRARLATISTPQQGKPAMTRAEFKRLSLSERQRLYVTDRELYRQLSNKN